MLWVQAKEYSLSPVQAQVLVFLLEHEQEKCTVSYLAGEFNVTKATISDVIRILVEKKLLQKKDSPADSRSQVLNLTIAGRRVAGTTGNFANSIMKYVSAFTHEQKIVLKDSLLVLIYNLYKDGVITVQRMCFTCRHYTSKNNLPFCGLLKILLISETSGLTARNMNSYRLFDLVACGNCRFLPARPQPLPETLPVTKIPIHRRILQEY